LIILSVLAQYTIKLVKLYKKPEKSINLRI